jgi:hypothetical protein
MREYFVLVYFGFEQINIIFDAKINVWSEFLLLKEEFHPCVRTGCILVYLQINLYLMKALAE